MTGNVFTKIKNCSENDALSLAFYLYSLVKELSSMDCHEECQILFNALVNRLGVQEHYETVLCAILNKLEKQKILTPENPEFSRPGVFNYRGSLVKRYREDESIYENCGHWETETPNDINLVRILFSQNKNIFSNVIALTFFTVPGCYDGKATIPNNVTVPARIKKAVNDTSSIQYVKDMLKLSIEEAQLLLVVYRMYSIREMYIVCNDLYRSDELSRIEIFSKCLDKTQKEIRLLLKKDRKLNSYGLLDDEGEMDADALDAIGENDMNIYFADIIKNEKIFSSYKPDSFSVKKEYTDLAIQFLKSSNACNILLYGAPGSGKTEFAKALVKQSGLKLKTYKNEIEVSSKNSEKSSSEKALSRLNCFLSLKNEDSILVVDEAETVLKTCGSFFGMKFSLPQKGTVNKLLENSENKVIWILNYTDELDISTLRRFTFSIRFHEMPKSTLRSIAEQKFSELKIPQTLKSDIIDLCGKYQVTGASVENIVKAVKSMDFSNNSPEKIKKDVRNVLEANSSLVFGKKKIRNSVRSTYDLNILNTSIPANDLVEMVENAVLDKEENPDNPEGIRMLFYGLSGTGKTELARFISEKLGKKLLLMRASDIMDKYVGESEKKIKDAFVQAEETDSILLFDEADSFFSDRESANNSWERTIVNEFLTQMEEFSGILICTTNLRKIMDPALQRRFHLMTEFKPLDKNGIRKLLDSYFGSYSFGENQIEELLRYNSITPGDFGSLSSRMRFISKSKLSGDYIVNELKVLQNEKNHSGFRIGFVS